MGSAGSGRKLVGGAEVCGDPRFLGGAGGDPGGVLLGLFGHGWRLENSGPLFLGGDFAEGLAPASEGDRYTGKFGYIDRQGRWAIEAEFDWARPFQEGFGGVKDGAKWGFVDKKGKLVVEPEFDQIGSFSGGLAPVQKGGAPGDKETWVYIKPDGSQPFEKKYARAGTFSDGLARVQVEDRITGKFGYIDTKGAMVIQPNFEEASDFRNGKAAVRVEGKSRVIDEKGNPVD